MGHTIQSNSGAKAQKSLIMGYIAWFSERFPLINIFSSFLLLFFIFSFATKVESVKAFVSLKEILLGMGILSQLLLLRILDEFKDHNYDGKFHPDRVLQKGILRLSDLRILLIVSIVFQIVLNFLYGSLLNINWMLMLAWTVLMTKEFFIAEWLRKRVFLYLISHMVVMVFLSFWILSFYTSETAAICMATGLIFLGSCLYELSRKSRGLDEDQNLDSYAQTLGFTGQSILLILAALFITALKYQILLYLRMELVWFYLFDVISLALFIGAVLYFLKKKSQKSRKFLEMQYGNLMLATYLTFICGVFFYG